MALAMLGACVSVPAAHSAYYLGPAVKLWQQGDCRPLAIGDVTGDGRADILMTSCNARAASCKLFVAAQGAGGRYGAPAIYEIDGERFGSGLALGDLNADGVLDVITGTETRVSILLADGRGYLMPPASVPVPAVEGIQTLDVDRDGRVDIVGMTEHDGNWVLFGDGLGAITEVCHLPAFPGSRTTRHVVIADVTGDCLPDLVVNDGADIVAPDLGIHRHDGAGWFTSPALTHGAGSHGQGLGVGDLDGDGYADVARSSYDDDSLAVFVQEGGDLAPPFELDVPGHPSAVVVGDVDADGLFDVAMFHNWNRQVSVTLQHPGMGLAGVDLTTPSLVGNRYVAPDGIAIGDVTSDGCPDIVISELHSGIVIYPGRGCPIVGDVDLDATPDTMDNCTSTPNPSQQDWDCDGLGDACDPCRLDPGNDADGDGRCNDATRTRPDADGDGRRDDCDPCPADPLDDADGDGRCADVDNCPFTPNPLQQDDDADGVGNACDGCADDDADGACNGNDNCEGLANPSQSDRDRDGLGDACDGDRDGDSIDDAADCQPDDPSLGAPPAEVLRLWVDRVPRSSEAIVSWWDQRPWEGPGAVFDLVAGDLGALHASRQFLPARCVVRGSAATAVTETSPGDHWYLVRLRSQCGTGSFGRSSTGANVRAPLDEPATNPCP